MFDIGFMELVLISVVALIVVGPERLPGAIRTATLWIGRAKRSFNQVKAEIEKEINADEIKRQLHNESILADLKKAKTQANKLVENTRQNLDKINADVNASLKQEEAALHEAVTREPPSAHTPPTTPVAEADTESDVSPEDAQESALPHEEETAPVEEGPVVDFYNNPPTGNVRVTGRLFEPTSSLDDETDSGRRS